MKHPDAVLNEVMQSVLQIALSESTKYFGKDIDPQEAVNLASDCLNNYLQRWSTYAEISSGGNFQAAKNILLGMLSKEILDKFRLPWEMG